MAAAKGGDSRASDVIRNWLRNRMTLEFLCTWEEIYNPEFKVFESEHFKKQVGLLTFTPSVSEWIEKTNAKGMYVKRGRYGGTFARKDIAFEFASAISPVFKRYLIKEFQRLKENENNQKKIEWELPDKSGMACPNLYSIWIYEEVFGERVVQIQELLKRYGCDVDEFFLNMPDMRKGTEEDPEYCWLPAGKYSEQEGGLDSQSYIEEWEEAEDFFEKFPSPEQRNLIPHVKLDHTKYILGRWWYCFFERHWSLRGMENALMDFYLYPEEVHRLYQKLTDFYMRIMERAKIEGGADGIFVSDDIGTQTGPFFSLEIFREFFRPYYKQLIEKAHELGMHFWLHTCGNIEPFMEDFIEIGLDVIHPIQKYTMDEKEIASKYGGRICFLAGFDVQNTIPFGTPDEVRKEVDYLIDTFQRPDGRLMLTMGNGATPDWTLESLEALYDETEKRSL